MARVTGPAAAALDGVFGFDWSTETAGGFEPPPAPDQGRPGGSTVQVVPSGPGLRPEAIHQLLLTAIYSARRELVMTTPYFVPDESILTALLSAALRGVEVTLIVPAHNDSLLVRYASVAHFDDLMSAGVRLALYRGGLLHTKSLAIDGLVGVFGSVNLDMRSLWLNFEISLFVYGTDFTGRLRALQDRYLRDSDRLELDRWRRRPARRRFLEDAFRLLGPLL
jgi:cardiolipin synthase